MRVVAAVVLGVVAIAVVVAARIFRNGASDVWFVVAMTLACVVGVALVAPSLFTGGPEDGSDYSHRIEELRKRDSDQKGKQTTPRKWSNES